MDGGRSDLDQEIEQLHGLCGIYTGRRTARKLLTRIGWSKSKDLTVSRLLDPCVGDGAFVVPAAIRLIESFRSQGKLLTFRGLKDRIVGYELHSGACISAQQNIVSALSGLDVSSVLAEQLGSYWIRNSDFLIDCSTDAPFTHLVANPPYVRWSKLPRQLSEQYVSSLSSDIARGDLCLPFIHRMFRLARPEGHIGLLCTDRWLYSSYAEDFRKSHISDVEELSRESVVSAEVFTKDVSTYPTILIYRKRPAESLIENFSTAKPRSGRKSKVADAVSTLNSWCDNFPALSEAGVRVKVGSALGHERAYVGQRSELEVESSLLARFVKPGDIGTSSIKWKRRYALNVFTDGDGLIRLSDYPKAEKHLRRFEEKLRARSCVSESGGDWFRTIDRCSSSTWKHPKLLVPEISRLPRVVLDNVGYQPSHGIYALFSEQWPLDILRAVLASGVMGLALSVLSPRVSGGYIRCYGKFLKQVPLPAWDALPVSAQAKLRSALDAGAKTKFINAVSAVYETKVSLLSQFASAGWWTMATK